MIESTSASFVRFVRGLSTREVARRMILLALAAFVADWASKSWALEGLVDAAVPLGALTLGVVRNEGFAFSWGHGDLSFAVVAGVRVGALGAFLLLLHRAQRLLRRRSAYGLALIVAGGLGNAADLVFYGSVVDFIGAGPIELGGPHAPFEIHLVFNLADLFILIGIGLMAPFIQTVARAAQERLAEWEGRLLGRSGRNPAH